MTRIDLNSGLTRVDLKVEGRGGKGEGVGRERGRGGEGRHICAFPKKQ